MLVCTPAGFGRTTLLGEWARWDGRPVAWLSLDAGDNDLTRFWRYVAAALDGVHAGVEDHLAGLLRGPQAFSPEGVAALTAFAAGQAMLLVQGAQGISLVGDPRVVRLMYAAMLWAPVCTLFAVALAFIFRKAGSAIAALLLIMSLELPINQLPVWGRAALLPLAPPQALYNLSGLAVPSDLAYASPGSAAFALVLWTGGLYALAYTLFQRRDM